MKLNLAVCSLLLCLASSLPEASANLRHGLKGARPSAETDYNNHAGKAHRSLKKEDQETDEKGVRGKEAADNKKGKGKQVTEAATDPMAGVDREEEVVVASNATVAIDREDLVDTNATIILAFDDDEDVEEDFQFQDPEAWDRIDEFMSGNLIDVVSSNATDSPIIVEDEIVVDREDAGPSNVVLSDLYDASKAGSSRQVFSENATFPDFTEPTLVEEPDTNTTTITGDKITVPLEIQKVVQTADIVEQPSTAELELRLAEVEIQMNTITTMAASIEKLESELAKVMQILNIHGGAISTLADRAATNQAPAHITGFDPKSEP